MSTYIVTKWLLGRGENNDKGLKFKKRDIKNMGPSNVNQICQGLNDEI